MKHCKHCGHPLSNEKSFCRNCGNPVTSEGPKRFCKLCGTLLKSDEEKCQGCLENSRSLNEKKRSFCKECGGGLTDDGTCQLCQSSPPLTIMCKNCGSPLLSADVPCEKCNETKSRRSRSRSSKFKRKSSIIIMILAVILLGAGTYGFMYVKDASSPVHATKALTEAVKNKDASTLGSLIEGNDPEKKLNLLLTDLHKDPVTLAKLYKNATDQAKRFATKEKTDPIPPFLFQLKKSPDKKWGLIDQYTFTLNPITLTLQTDPDAQLFVNNVEVPESGTDLRLVEDLLPGEITVKAVMASDSGNDFETSETFPLWETNSTPISLQFKKQYVTVTSDRNEVDLYVNGELYYTIDQTGMEIGPFAPGDTITINGVYHSPWGDVESEEFEVGASETVELLFPPPVETIRDEVIDSVKNFNESYIESITDLDSSVLRNVKGPKLQETIGIINDLRQRNVTYGGYIEELIFDGQSFTFDEEGAKASISVAEHYASSWNDPTDEEAATFKDKTYYFTYYCEFDSDTDEWMVVDSKEHNELMISDPL